MQLNARAGLSHALEIAATGFAYPGDLVDNDAYFARCQWPRTENRELLETETGVRSRWWCTPADSVRALAERALDMALAQKPALRDHVDVILATSSTTTAVLRPVDPDDPGHADVAQLLVRGLGRDGVLGLDLKSCYCTGFLRALQVLDGLLANPNYRAGAIVSVERSSPFCTSAGNRSNFTFIFGDAAGAAVVQKHPLQPGVGIIDYAGFIDAAKHDFVRFEHDGQHVASRGATLKAAAIDLMVDCGRTLLKRNRLDVADIAWLLPLQTSSGIVFALSDALGFPREKVLWNGAVTGFSGSASIPAALAEQIQNDTIQKGDLILSLAVGAGLNVAGTLYHY